MMEKGEAAVALASFSLSSFAASGEAGGREGGREGAMTPYGAAREDVERLKKGLGEIEERLKGVVREMDETRQELLSGPPSLPPSFSPTRAAAAAATAAAAAGGGGGQGGGRGGRGGRMV